MVSLLVYDSDRQEGEIIISQARDAVAYLSDDQLRVESFNKAVSMKDYFSGSNLMDMAFLDVTAEDGVKIAVQIRHANQEAELLLLADASVSPMMYLKPSIRASSLLLRPFSEKQGKTVITEFIHAFYKNHNAFDNTDMFVLESREGRMTIPYSKIYYLEVREKRVYVRLKNTEYFKYGTLSKIMEELPGDFIRCHRSFVVNKAFIRQVHLTEGSISLADDIEIPLSRSYKGAIREYLYELRSHILH